MPLNETDPPVSHSRRSAFAGVLIGVTALIGTIVGVAAIASAEDMTVTGDDTAPETTIPVVTVPAGAHGDEITYDDDYAAYDACMAEELGDLWMEPQFEMFDEGGDVPFGMPFDDATEQRYIDAEAACENQLPDDVRADIEAWRPYEECVDDQVGDLGEPVVNAEDPADADWEAYDAAWQAADEACRGLLPDDVQAEMAAWDAFNECINDADPFGGEFSSGAVVNIETPDGFQMVEFGEIEGSVTITGTADGVTVTSTGGVTVLDESTLDAEWEAFDAAQAECEQLLPEDAFG
jgi:hypothetical protein